MTTITEDDVEQLAIGWLGDVGWHTVNGIGDSAGICWC